jgi:hypothetical protein
MNKIRYSQTRFARFQIASASMLLLTAPKWHWMQCQGLLYDVPLWALSGFTCWRIFRGFSMVRGQKDKHLHTFPRCSTPAPQV